MMFNFTQMPIEVMNCEYWEEIKRQWWAGELDKDCLRAALDGLPLGHKVMAWIERPITQGAHNVLTMEKFDQ